ncbi:unnamed protein product [Phaeothamnion confervicola]
MNSGETEACGVPTRALQKVNPCEKHAGEPTTAPAYTLRSGTSGGGSSSINVRWIRWQDASSGAAFAAAAAAVAAVAAGMATPSAADATEIAMAAAATRRAHKKDTRPQTYPLANGATAAELAPGIHCATTQSDLKRGQTRSTGGRLPVGRATTAPRGAPIAKESHGARFPSPATADKGRQAAAAPLPQPLTLGHSQPGPGVPAAWTLTTPIPTITKNRSVHAVSQPLLHHSAGYFDPWRVAQQPRCYVGSGGSAGVTCGGAGEISERALDGQSRQVILDAIAKGMREMEARVQSGW